MKKENLEQLDYFAQNQEVREAVSAKVSKSSEILPGMYIYANQNEINAAKNKLYDSALGRNVWFSTEPHTSPMLDFFMGDRYRGGDDKYNGNYVRPVIIL